MITFTLLLAPLFVEDHLSRCPAELAFAFSKVGKRVRCELTVDQATELYSDACHYASMSGVDRQDNFGLCASASAVKKAIETQAPEVPKLMAQRAAAAAEAFRALQASPEYQERRRAQQAAFEAEQIERARYRLPQLTVGDVEITNVEVLVQGAGWYRITGYSHDGTVFLKRLLDGASLTVGTGRLALGVQPWALALRRTVYGVLVTWER